MRLDIGIPENYCGETDTNLIFMFLSMLCCFFFFFGVVVDLILANSNGCWHREFFLIVEGVKSSCPWPVIVNGASLPQVSWMSLAIHPTSTQLFMQGTCKIHTWGEDLCSTCSFIGCWILVCLLVGLLVSLMRILLVSPWSWSSLFILSGSLDFLLESTLSSSSIERFDNDFSNYSSFANKFSN